MAVQPIRGVPYTIVTKTFSAAAATLDSAVTAYLGTLDTAGKPWEIIHQSQSSAASDDAVQLVLTIKVTDIELTNP